MSDPTLKSALLRVKTRLLSSFYDESSIAVQIVDDEIKNLASNKEPVYLDPHKIIYYTAKYYGVTQEELKSPSRCYLESKARKVAAYIIRTNTNLSLHNIVSLFSRADHTTAIYWIKWCSEQKDYTWFISDLEAILWNVRNGSDVAYRIKDSNSVYPKVTDFIKSTV